MAQRILEPGEIETSHSDPFPGSIAGSRDGICTACEPPARSQHQHRISDYLRFLAVLVDAQHSRWRIYPCPFQRRRISRPRPGTVCADPTRRVVAHRCVV